MTVNGSNEGGFANSIAVDSNNKVYISYYDSNSLAVKLAVEQ